MRICFFTRNIYLKRFAIPLIIVLFILFLLLFSNTVITSARKGLKLWLDIVFPSLFPFFAASELLNGTGFIRAFGILFEPIMRPIFNVPGCSSFTFLMGITSGYPVGARITVLMRKDGQLSKIEAERLISFSNNSGPLFIVGAVATGMFGMPQAGALLLVTHIFACVTVGLIFRYYGRSERQRVCYSSKSLLAGFKKEILSDPGGFFANPGERFANAVKNSIMTLLLIGGFIILFSVIINLLLETGFIRIVSEFASIFLGPLGINKDIVTSIISGFFEITTGTNMAAAVSGPLPVKLAAAGMIIGWAGLSVHSQVLSIISDSDISIKPYLIGKFLQGIFAGIYTYAAIKITGALFLNYRPAFLQIYTSGPAGWIDYFLLSCRYLAIFTGSLMLIFILSLMLHKYKSMCKGIKLKR